MDERRLARTLRANHGNDWEVYVQVKSFGCQLDELWTIATRCGRYLPDVMEIVDESQSPARVLVLNTAHNHLRINLSGRRGRFQVIQPGFYWQRDHL